MVRLLLVGALFGGAIIAFGPRAQQRPEPDDPPASEQPDATEESTDPRAESPSEPNPRRSPRQRAELDLPTRDLLLRGTDDAEEASPSEHIVETLEREMAVEIQGKTLRETLVDLAHSAEINLYIDEFNDDRGIPSATLDDRVTLAEQKIRLESLIDRLLEPRNLAWTIRHEALWIQTKSDVERHLETRTYDVARLLAAGHQQDDLIKAVAKAAVQPDALETGFACGGRVLFVHHNQPAQRVIARVLAEMEEIALQQNEDDNHRSTPQAEVAPPRKAVVQLAKFIRPANAEKPAEKPAEPSENEIFDALDEPHDVEFVEQTVAECLDALREAAGVRFHVDVASIKAAGNEASLQSKPRFKLTGARLESVLGTLLEPRGLGWLIRDDSLWITDATIVKTATDTKTYDVMNLFEAGHDPVELAEAILATIAPGRWSPDNWSPDNWSRETPHVTGSLAITGDVLVVRHTQSIHWDIAQLLAELDLIVEESEKNGETRRQTLTWETYRVPAEAAEALAKTLPDIVAPDSWATSAKRLSPRPEAEIRAVPGMLFIRQTRANHKELRRLLPGS